MDMTTRTNAPGFVRVGIAALLASVLFPVWRMAEGGPVSSDGIATIAFRAGLMFVVFGLAIRYGWLGTTPPPDGRRDVEAEDLTQPTPRAARGDDHAPRGFLRIAACTTAGLAVAVATGFWAPTAFEREFLEQWTPLLFLPLSIPAVAVTLVSLRVGRRRLPDADAGASDA